MVATDNNKFRALPSVDKILAAKESRALAETYSHGALVTLALETHCKPPGKKFPPAAPHHPFRPSSKRLKVGPGLYGSPPPGR